MTSSKQSVVIWFRNDLRLRDNPLFYQKSVTNAKHVVPVYFIDPRYFGSNADLHPKWEARMDASKTGIFRARFLLESLIDLQQNLRQLGSDLLIFLEEPEKRLPILLQNVTGTTVLCEHGVGSEEATIESTVAKVLKPLNAKLELLWGAQTLYAPTDLPFKFSALPEPFTSFRKAVEWTVWVRKEVQPPRLLAPFPESVRGAGIALEDVDAVLRVLGFSEDEVRRKPDARVQTRFLGGETAALSRMEDFVRVGLGTYKQTRNRLVGNYFSSKLSPWLAHGCVSPRTVYWAVKAYEEEFGESNDTYWLIFELMWRDWFRFFAQKHGKKIYYGSGPAGLVGRQWSLNMERFEKWRLGETGVPFVDANMRELMLTGFMSNRGRQNVASFLVHDLRVDWRLGAQWFEHALLDHEPASNYGNWVCAAGVGMPDQRLNKFNIAKQARDYDPEGEFMNLWLPGSGSQGQGKGGGKQKRSQPNAVVTHVESQKWDHGKDKFRLGAEASRQVHTPLSGTKGSNRLGGSSSALELGGGLHAGFKFAALRPGDNEAEFFPTRIYLSVCILFAVLAIAHVRCVQSFARELQGPFLHV